MSAEILDPCCSGREGGVMGEECVLSIIDNGRKWSVTNYLDASATYFTGSLAECGAWIAGFKSAVDAAAALCAPGEEPPWGWGDGSRDDLRAKAEWAEACRIREAILTRCIPSVPQASEGEEKANG